MPTCLACHGTLVRVHRRFFERPVFAEAWRCRQCGGRIRLLGPRLAFLLSTHTRCIRCGSEAVRRQAKPDRIETVARQLASRLQQVTGAPINWCAACRLQYYDWRPVHTKAASADTPVEEPGTPDDDPALRRSS